jgi:hypothetical protein
MPTRSDIEQHLLNRPAPAPWAADCVLPDYGGYSIVGLAGLIDRFFGGEEPSSKLADLASDVPAADHVILLLTDGLGYRKTESLFERFPDSTLASLAETGLFLPLTSVFPATTVAALASIGTGRTPLEHGLIGYRLYLRETSAVTNMIRYSMVGNGRGDAAFHAGLDVETIVPSPTLHERLDRNAVEAHTLLPQHIAGSGLSRALYRGNGRVHATAGLTDMLVMARDLVGRATSRTFLSLYWPGLDTVAHIRGPESAAYVAEWRALDDALRRELVGQVDKTLLIVASDHGFVTMRPSDYLQPRDLPDLDRGLLLPPVGEPRASYLYVRDGVKETVMRAVDRGAADGLVCIDSAALVDDGLLGHGTPHPEIAHRIGDLAVLSTGAAGLFHPYQDAILLRGMHGGLTEEEMLVPLIACQL